MKTLMLENEAQLDEVLVETLCCICNTGIVEDITVLTNCRNKTVELVPEILTSDRLIVSSRFLYKKQLESLVHVICTKPSLEIWVHNGQDLLQEILDSNYKYYQNPEQFKSDILLMLQQEQLWEYSTTRFSTPKKLHL